MSNDTSQRSATPLSLLFPALVFFITLGILWGWMILVRWLIPLNTSPDPVLRPYMGVEPESQPLLAIWQRWDTLHYQAIAERGYSAFDTSLFTPPLYPFLMRVVSFLSGGNTLLAGMIISLAACISAIIIFYRLAQFELKDESRARWAVIYLAIFPTSFFLFAPYTEPLFLTGAVLCLLAMRKGDWLTAGFAGAFAASTRLTGAILFLPVLWYAYKNWLEMRKPIVWLAPFLVAATSASFPLYTWLGLGYSITAPFEAQSQRFHGGITLPGVNIVKAFQEMFAGNFPATNFLDIFFTLIFLAVGVGVWKKLPRIYGVYYASFMAVYLIRIANVYPLLSMSRYVLSLFPAFLVMAQYDENPILKRILIYGSILGALFLSAQFAMWGWVG